MQPFRMRNRPAIVNCTRRADKVSIWLMCQDTHSRNFQKNAVLGIHLWAFMQWIGADLYWVMDEKHPNGLSAGPVEWDINVKEHHFKMVTHAEERFESARSVTYTVPGWNSLSRQTQEYLEGHLGYLDLYERNCYRT